MQTSSTTRHRPANAASTKRASIPPATNTSSGDHWAQLTVITGGASYAFNPAGNDTISGLGDGAYWDAGTHTVVIRQGQNVLQVIDEVPVNLSASPDLLAAYRQAAHALATKILSHE
jgi:hypothetical protein